MAGRSQIGQIPRLSSTAGRRRSSIRARYFRNLRRVCARTLFASVLRTISARDYGKVRRQSLISLRIYSIVDRTYRRSSSQRHQHGRKVRLRHPGNPRRRISNRIVQLRLRAELWNAQQFLSCGFRNSKRSRNSSLAFNDTRPPFSRIKEEFDHQRARIHKHTLGQVNQLGPVLRRAGRIIGLARYRRALVELRISD